MREDPRHPQVLQKRPTLQQKIAIHDRLTRVLTDTGEKDKNGRTIYRYHPGVTDQTIAQEYGVSRHVIYYTRVQLFGPLIGSTTTPHQKQSAASLAVEASILRLRKDRDILRSALRALASEVANMYGDLGDKVGAQRVRDEMNSWLSNLIE